MSKHSEQFKSTIALVAVLTAPGANSNRVDVMAAWMLFVAVMNIGVKPECWGPSIHSLEAQALVFADMATIQAIGDLRSIYEVPTNFALDAEAVWLDVHAEDAISVGFDHAH